MKLIATKSMIYGTRRLLPGDMFDAPDRDARVLIGIRKAKDGTTRTPGKVPPPPEDVARKIEQATGGDVAALRAEYEALVGKRPFMGWTADQLRDRIREARG